jgi:hypothetical protein
VNRNDSALNAHVNPYLREKNILGKSKGQSIQQGDLLDSDFGKSTSGVLEGGNPKSEDSFADI